MKSKPTPTALKPSKLSGVPWEPRPYQIEGIRFLLEHGAAGLLLKPGMAKTSITLGAIKILKREGVIKRCLIVAPVRVCYSVWPAEVAKWADFNGLKVELLHGPKKDEALQRDADIYLINPEGLAWLLGATKERLMRHKGKRIPFDPTRVGEPNISIKSEVRYDYTKFKKLGADTLVLDEASKFRKPGTDRFNMLKTVLDKFDRRWILTGSPTPKWLLDLFGVLYCIDMGRSLGAYITHYRNQYFTPMGFGGYTWVPQHGAAERIHERIAPVIFSLSDKDYVKIPQLVEIPIQVELPPAARKLYDEVEDEFFAELDDGTPIVAANAGVASIKCRQIANGGLFLQPAIDAAGRPVGKRTWLDIHSEKTQAARDVVDELMGAPVLIAYDFEHDLARLLAEFGKDTPYIGGGVSAKKSDTIIAAWNANEIDVLLGHPAAMAHGLNAQQGNACNMIWHSLNPDYELYDQFLRRLMRSGNKSAKLFVHLICAKNTVDTATMLMLRKKEATQNALLEAMNEYSIARRGRGITRKPRRSL